MAGFSDTYVAYRQWVNEDRTPAKYQQQLQEQSFIQQVLSAVQRDLDDERLGAIVRELAEDVE